MINKVVILGSSGYIGSNLYKYFKKKDFKTIGISRKSSSTTTHCVALVQTLVNRKEQGAKPTEAIYNGK